MPHKEKGDRMIMKMTGALVDILLKLDPDKFKGYTVCEKWWKVIYMVVLREIYGIFVASLLCYHKFNKYLKLIGFVFNNYGTCVANSTDN